MTTNSKILVQGYERLNPEQYCSKLQRLIETVFLAMQKQQTQPGICEKFSGIQLYIEAPDLGLSWGGAVGHIDFSHTEQVEPKHPIRIASNTKTFVAAAILRLWEEQRLDLDKGINNYLCAEHNELIQSHGYSLKAITIRHLLTHTSGLFDYADSPVFQARLISQPRHKWTRREQLELAMHYGQPYGAPGEVYRYSDTGYILLGEIVEHVSGLSLGLALRQLLDYQSLGLNITWLEQMEEEPAGLPKRVKQYIGQCDANTIDASCDIYGGGGLVSTVKDLACFFSQLFYGNVFLKDKTLQEMLTTVDAASGGPDAYDYFEQVPGAYRLGVEAEQDGHLYGHAGYLGTYAGFIPDNSVAFAFSINQHQSRIARDTLKKSIVHLFSQSS